MCDVFGDEMLPRQLGSMWNYCLDDNDILWRDEYVRRSVETGVNCFLWGKLLYSEMKLRSKRDTDSAVCHCTCHHSAVTQ